MTRATYARRARPRPAPRPIPLVVLPSLEPELARPRRRETIAQLVERQGWAARGLPLVCGEMIAGELKPVMRADWGRRIRPRDEFVFMAQPLDGGGGGGGGSRSVASLVAMVALIAIASAVAGPAGMLAGMGLGATGLAVASALIVAGGAFLISHFLQPKAGAKSKDQDPLTISLQGNQARPQQPIPVHYGRMKFNPDFCTPAWADFSGVDQTFHGLYCLGVGEFEIEEIGIGGVPIWTAADGVAAEFPTFQHQVAGPDVPVTLFPSNVAVAPDVTGQQLLPPVAGAPQYMGPFIINPPASIGRTVAVDLIWPGGCYHMDGQNQRPSTTNIVVQYRMIDDVGVPIGGVGAVWNNGLTLNYSFESKVPIRRTEKFTIPPGRVQLRVARTNALDTTGTNDVVWAGARLYLEGANTRPKVTQLAVQLVSDKSLSSYNSQQVYVIATRKIPVWSGAAWVTQATQNPVWAAIDMWHNADYGGGQPLTHIDLASLSARAADADARGDTFNHRLSTEMTVLEALTLILRVMLAEPVYVFDRFGIVRDEERLAPTLVLNDFHIVRGSAQLTYTLQDDQTADGVIVEYLEEQTWARADVASSGSLSTLVHPSRVQVPGATDRRQVTLIARYLAAVNRYRRTVLSLQIEAEGKLLRRGQLVAVQTEMPATWGQALRIDAYNVVARSLTFHAPAQWAASGNHYVRLRCADGSPFGPLLVTQGASASIAIISASDLTTVEAQQGITLDEVLARSNVSEPPSCSFSEGQPREFLGLVTHVGNAGENRFSVDLVNDAPEVYEIDDADVPALPDAPQLSLPEAPGLLLDFYATLSQFGLALQLAAAWRPDPSAQTYTARVSLDEGETWSTIYPAGYESSFLFPGLPDRDLILEVRGVSAAGNPGPWTRLTLVSPGVVKTTDALGIGLSPGAITAANFASSLQAVGVVSALPNPVGYVGLPLVMLTTDRQLYSYVGGAWTGATAANILANSIVAGMIQAGAVKASAIDVTTLSAIASNIGTIIAGLLQSADGKMQMNLDGGYLLFAE